MGVVKDCVSVTWGEVLRVYFTIVIKSSVRVYKYRIKDLSYAEQVPVSEF